MKGGPASNENTGDRPSFLRQKVAKLKFPQESIEVIAHEPEGLRHSVLLDLSD